MRLTMERVGNQAFQASLQAEDFYFLGYGTSPVEAANDLKQQIGNHIDAWMTEVVSDRCGAEDNHAGNQRVR